MQCGKGIDVISRHKIELATGFEIEILYDDDDDGERTVIAVSFEKTHNAMMTVVTLSQSEAIELGQALVDVSDVGQEGAPIL